MLHGYGSAALGQERHSPEYDYEGQRRGPSSDIFVRRSASHWPRLAGAKKGAAEAARSVRCETLADRELAVIVAVAAVRMMQVPADEVVDVISVRHGFVPTSVAMLVGRIVGTASMGRCARSRVGPADRDRVLLHAIALRMVQMTVVEVVSVPVVLHG